LGDTNGESLPISLYVSTGLPNVVIFSKGGS